MVDKLRANRIEATTLGIESDEKTERELLHIINNTEPGKYSEEYVQSSKKMLEQVKASKQSRTKELGAAYGYVLRCPPWLKVDCSDRN